MFNSKKSGHMEGNIRAVTLPKRGIVAAFTSGVLKGKRMMQHEYGHILQYRKFGAYIYWHAIASESFASATLSPSTHGKFWTETWANYLSKEYFGKGWLGKDDYPVKNISTTTSLMLKAIRVLGNILPL